MPRLVLVGEAGYRVHENGGKEEDSRRYLLTVEASSLQDVLAVSKRSRGQDSLQSLAFAYTNLERSDMAKNTEGRGEDGEEEDEGESRNAPPAALVQLPAGKRRPARSSPGAPHRPGLPTLRHRPPSDRCPALSTITHSLLQALWML